MFLYFFIFLPLRNDYLSKAICADLSKVVSNIRKGEKKKNRKSKSSTVDDATSLASGSKVSRTTKRTRKTIISEVIHESSDDEKSDEEFDPKVKKSTPKISLAEDDEDFDLLDSKKKIVHVKESTDQISESDDEIRVGEDGKLIIPGASGMKRKHGHLSEDEDEEEQEDANDAKSVQSRKSSASKYQPGGRGIHRKIHRKHEHLLESIKTGDEFKSKRARGDVKRKDTNTDPYAYFPLVRASLNKRRKVSLKDQFKKVLSKNSK